MSGQPVEPVPPELAKAFSDAVFAFGVWSPGQNGRVIPIRRRGFYSISSVCDFVDRFTAPECGRLGRLLRDEAFLIAVNIAKLPSVPRQILKDIPRPPNSASRDD
jgi:hypothetical protein